MSISGGIFGHDLVRLAKSGDAGKLEGRPNTDPTVILEYDYFQKHGATRAQVDERIRLRRHQDRIDAALSDLRGEPPEGICNDRGVGPKRARYARYAAWRQGEVSHLSSLGARKREMEGLVEAPAATEAQIRGAVKRKAAALMGRDVVGEDVNRKELDERLSSERHTAEAAQEALVELNTEIEVYELRVAHLHEREKEFLHPALVEAGDAIGLGALYLKKIAELREVAALVYGLQEVAGGFQSGFENTMPIAFPRAGFPSLSKATRADYAIDEKGRADVWRSLAQSLLLDPRHDASKFIPLPK